MAKKGEELNTGTIRTAEGMAERLASIPQISFKKMFGGHGMMHEGKMFGLIDAKGVAFLKVPKGEEAAYISQGAKQHSRMPYYSITDAMYADKQAISNWAEVAIAASK